LTNKPWQLWEDLCVLFLRYSIWAEKPDPVETLFDHIISFWRHSAW
jgi:hypothetical protein